MALHVRTALKYICLFLIGVAVLCLAFKGQNLPRIWQEIRNANFFWVIFSSFVVWLAHVLRALRWQMLYNSIQYKVSFWHAYHAVLIGYLANLALPRFGEVGRCSVIQKTDKVPMFASIGTVITERLFDVAILLLTGLLLLVFQYDIVYGFINEVIFTGIANRLKEINLFWILGLGVILLIFILVSIYYLRNKFNNKYLRVAVSLRQGFMSYRKLDNKILFLIYSIGIWLLYFFSMYFAFFSIEATSELSLSVAFTAVVFSGFAMVAPIQGGIGVFHWMVAQALVLHATSFNNGLAYATIIHSSQVLVILILGSFSLLYVLTKGQRKLK